MLQFTLSLIPCAILFPCAYLYVRARLAPGGTSREYAFYRFVAGALLGELLRHALFHRWMPVHAALCVVGYMLMEAGEALPRAFNGMLYEVSPVCESKEQEEEEEEEGAEGARYVTWRDASTEAYASAAFRVHDTEFLNRKRVYLTMVLSGVLVYLAVADGLYAADRDASSTFAYWVYKVLQTALIISLAVHARIHRIYNHLRRLLWWGLLTLFWTLCVGLSSIPLYYEYVPPHEAFTYPYAVAMGALLWGLAYFKNYKLRDTDRTNTLLGLILGTLVGVSGPLLQYM